MSACPLVITLTAEKAGESGDQRMDGRTLQNLLSPCFAKATRSIKICVSFAVTAVFHNPLPQVNAVNA